MFKIFWWYKPNNFHSLCNQSTRINSNNRFRSIPTFYNCWPSAISFGFSIRLHAVPEADDFPKSAFEWPRTSREPPSTIFWFKLPQMTANDSNLSALCSVFQRIRALSPFGFRVSDFLPRLAKRNSPAFRIQPHQFSFLTFHFNCWLPFYHTRASL